MLSFVCIARAGGAQTLTTVRVPASATEKYVANACSVSSPKTILDSAGKLNTNSRLEVHVENDQNKGAKPSVPLVIVAGKQGATLSKDSSAASISGDYTGQTVTITRATDSVLVCALTVPALVVASDTAMRAFRVGIGGSFDFLSGVSPTNLYSDVTVFLPNLWNRPLATEKQSRIGAFGIDAGLYNGRTVPKRDSTIVDAAVMSGRSRVLPRTALTDPTTRIRQTIARTRSESVDRLGIYFGPTMKVAEGLYVVVSSELVRRDIVVESRNRVVEQDTLVEAPDQTPLSGAGTLLPSDTTVKTRATDYLGLYSTGVLISTRLRDVEFRVRTTIGLSVGDDAVGDSKTGAAYATQFRVTAFEQGFKIGGDVRGRLNGDDTTFLVYLAKDFSFERLASFILGSGESDAKK